MPEGPPDRFAANPDQAEYWNSEAGHKWVTFQEALDRRFGPITDGLMELAAPTGGEIVVDVGCGTGTSTLRLASAVGAQGRVLGIDISEPLLTRARERCAGQPHVRFGHADAQTHPLGEAHDLAISRFGVMFFADPIAAFRNLASALRSGGRLAFACWAAVDANPWFATPLAVGVARLGPPEPTRPRAPGPFAFSDPEYVFEILRSAGFESIRIEPTSTILPGAPTAVEEAEFAAALGPLARLLRERKPDEATRETIVRDVAEGFRVHEGADGVLVPATVLRVSAARAG